ncbi:hypothetical protein ACTJJ0_24230 [Chitinophaga sp. 22321]|uniref:hypothetical protein n=1 Tax=Chitinophaga TaxID=79328 RepID=UPI003F6A4F71
MKYMKWFISSFLCLFCTLSGSTQSVENMDKAVEMLEKASKAYDSGQVSFLINYTYANEQAPTVLLDSLSGEVMMSGRNYFSRMRNTTFLMNQHYSVAVFNDDKLIHVSRPVNRDSIGVTPMQMVSGAIRQAGIKSCAVSSKGDTARIRFTFSAATYKYMEIQLDTRNWRIHQLQFVVKSDAAPGEGESYNTNTGYALVKASFHHYSNKEIDPVVFDERQFFSRTATSLIPATAYQDYEVFIASPNL